MRNPSLAEALGHAAADKRIELLRLIAGGGSISQAARDAGVSYKAAWQAIDTLTNLAGVALVEKAVGGAGGGGARITAAGRQLLATADAMTQARARVLADAKRQPALAASAGLGALALRTSMRNQLPCTVRVMRAAAGAMRVVLALADGTELASRITRESAQLLAIKPGQPVLALCKATAVDVRAQARAAAGRNLLRGSVTRVSRAREGGEVALQLAGGLQLVGFAGPEHGLALRAEAVACLDESAVVIALSA